MKVFYPQEYFKHAGYQIERQERFNEPLESQSRQSKKDECLSIMSKATSQKNKEKSKQKIIEKLNSLDDRDLDQLKKNLNIQEENEDGLQSVITQDKL